MVWFPLINSECPNARGTETRGSSVLEVQALSAIFPGNLVSQNIHNKDLYGLFASWEQDF